MPTTRRTCRRGPRKVSALDTEHVEVYRAERLDEGISAATINPEVEFLLAALTWGVERKRIAANPVAKLRPLKHHKKESRPLTVAEVRQLLDASTILAQAGNLETQTLVKKQDARIEADRLRLATELADPAACQC
jgi:site-specific recombinase XerC